MSHTVPSGSVVVFGGTLPEARSVNDNAWHIRWVRSSYAGFVNY